MVQVVYTVNKRCYFSLSLAKSRKFVPTIWASYRKPGVNSPGFFSHNLDIWGGDCYYLVNN